MDAHEFIPFSLLTQHPIEKVHPAPGKGGWVRKRLYQDPVDIARNVAMAQLDATNGPGSRGFSYPRQCRHKQTHA